MNAKRIKVSVCLAPVILAAAFLVLHALYVTRTHPDATYMDTLRVIYQLKQWSAGHMSLLALWGLGHEHQGLINQVFVMANIKFFSLNILLANRLTGVIIFIVTLILLLNFSLAIHRLSKKPLNESNLALITVSAIIAAICFSWAGFELLTLDLGLSQWVKNLSFVLYFVAHAYYLNNNLSKQSSFVLGSSLGLVGAFIVLMIAMGWSYAFVGAVLFVYVFTVSSAMLRGKTQVSPIKFLPLGLLLAAQALYVLASLGAGGVTAPHPGFATFGRVPELMLYALGSGIVGQEALLQYSISLDVAAYIGAISVAAAVVLLFQRFRQRTNAGSTIPLYLVAYGFLMALSVSVARGDAGIRDVMASRYYLDLMLFYVGLIWLWYESVVASNGNGRLVSRALFCGFLVVVVTALGLTYRREWAAAPYRAMAFRAMNHALEEGVPSEASAKLLQSPLVYARLGDQVMLEDHLALYANLPSDACQPSGVRFLGGWYPKEATGIWMSKTSILQLPACRCEFVASVLVPGSFSHRTMTIADGTVKDLVNLQQGKVETIRVPPSKVPRLLKIAVSETTVPAALQGADGKDERDLGAYWGDDYNFICRPDPTR